MSGIFNLASCYINLGQGILQSLQAVSAFGNIA